MLLAGWMQGVAFLRQHMQLHRDIKPSNILMSNDGVVKIADLGIARQLGSSTSFATENYGSELYLAPERLTIDPGTVQHCFRLIPTPCPTVSHPH